MFCIVLLRKNRKEKLIQAISDKVKSHNMFSWCQLCQLLFLPLPQLQALAEALEANKTLRSLTVAAPWEAPGFVGLQRVLGLSCSWLNWVPGHQGSGRDEERSRRQFPIHVDRRKGS